MCGVCICGGSIAKWLGHQPGNQKVPGSARNCTHIAPVYPAVQWGPGGLMSTEEAALPTDTSMGTWCKLGKQMLNCPCLT